LNNYSKALIIYQKFHRETHPTIKLIQNNINILQKLL
jgi:hypothetical protein